MDFDKRFALQSSLVEYMRYHRKHSKEDPAIKKRIMARYNRRKAMRPTEAL